jgi:polar amino acid transport system substrate-binding protein
MSHRKAKIEEVSYQLSVRRDFLKSAVVGSAALGGSLLTPPSAAAQSGDDVLQKVTRAKLINIAVVIYPPLTIKQDGELSGTFIEAAKWLAQEMDAKVNFVEAEFGTFIAAIQSGRADVAMSGSYATVPRAMAVDFTKNIMYIGYSALVRKADVGKWKTIEQADQSGVRFIEAEGAAQHKMLTQMLRNAKLTSTAAGTSPANMALEVIANRADIHVNDDWLVKRLVEAHKDRLAEMPAYTDKPWRLNAVSWAVAKGQAAMLNVLNVAIDRLLDNNLFVEWDRKYGANWLYKKDVYVQGSRLT